MNQLHKPSNKKSLRNKATKSSKGKINKSNPNIGKLRSDRSDIPYRKGYLLNAVLLMTLVVFAFMLPQVVLVIQDKNDMNDIYLISRTGLDYAATDIEYTTDRKERMALFAEGLEQGHQYFITSSEDTDSKDDNSLIQTVMEQEWFYFLYEGSFLDSTDIDNNIELMKKEYFVIYNDDAGSGASFVCWYLQLCYKDIFELHVLMDARDNSLYYIEIYSLFASQYLFNQEDFFTLCKHYLTNLFPYLLESDLAQEEILSDNANSSIGMKKPLVLQVLNGEIQQKIYFNEKELTLTYYMTNDMRQGFPGLCIGVQELIDLIPEDRKAVKLKMSDTAWWYEQESSTS